MGLSREGYASEASINRYQLLGCSSEAGGCEPHGHAPSNCSAALSIVTLS